MAPVPVDGGAHGVWKPNLKQVKFLFPKLVKDWKTYLEKRIVEYTIHMQNFALYSSRFTVRSSERKKEFVARIPCRDIEEKKQSTR